MQEAKISYPRGSEWRKWDLHVHTPASHLSARFGDDWNDYVQTLFKTAIVKGVQVLGIADYFTIDGYKRIKQEYVGNEAKLQELFTAEEIEKIKGILLLPNIEFRLNKFVEKNRINFHVILSDKIPVKDIEENFLHDIDFVFQGDPQDADKKSKLKIANLEELGKRLREEDEAMKQAGSDLFVGMMSAVVDDDQISKQLSQRPSKFKGKYLLGVVPDEDLSKVDWKAQDHQARKVLIQKSDFFFSSNSKTRNWALGQKPYMQGVDAFIKEFKSLKPCIHGSDPKKKEEICHPCGRRGEQGHSCKDAPKECDLKYCWIKADPTFEGLKQLLYEPDERVVIQPTDPTALKSNYSIDTFNITQSVIDETLSLKETHLLLNSYLVAIAGSKGAGKTALVDLIANNFFNQSISDNDNSFVRRIASEAPDLKTELVFRNGEIFSKQLDNGQFFESSPAIYIAQGQLDKYVGEGSDLNTHVNDLIFESPQIKDTVIRFEFLTIGESLKEIVESLRDQHVGITDFERFTSDEQVRTCTVDKKQQEAELGNVESRIQVMAEGQTKEQLDIAQDKQESLARLKKRKESLIKLQNLLKEASRSLDKDILRFNTTIESINDLVAELALGVQLEKLSYEHTGDMETLRSTIQVEVVNTVLEIEAAQKDLENIESGIKEHAKLLEKKREISMEIEVLAKHLEIIDKTKNELHEAQEQRKTLLRNLLTTILSAKQKYDEIIGKFSSEKAQVLSDLDFVAEIKFHRKHFVNRAYEILDNRMVTVEEVDGKESDFKTLLSLIDDVAAGDNGKIDEYVDEVERLTVDLKTKRKKSETITIRDFYDFLYDNYFEVTPIVKYKNTHLGKLSLGQKATVLIKIYLAQGDRPIIIDSHDDHLDNEFIMDELVPAIREAKRYRQVIIVSNNGNMVVNSDSEQVVLASRDNKGEISYISGSLENETIRDHALEVLEGGYKAFKKRQEKYRINPSK